MDCKPDSRLFSTLFLVLCSYNFLVPSVAVGNFSAVQVTMTTIMLSWEPVPCLSSNGDITSYTLTAASLYDPITISIGIGIQNYTLENLIPGTEYQISVTAINVNGTGPVAMVTNTTDLAPGSHGKLDHCLIYYIDGILNACTC